MSESESKKAKLASDERRMPFAGQASEIMSESGACFRRAANVRTGGQEKWIISF